MQQNYKIVGTAGHIDHGKSALVQALTGTDPDRLQEEQDRGITIDLGFAHLDLDNTTRVGFIDVPGHERFVKNMLAGIGGIDAVMFVVAADESIMPQTREHLAICRLLGVDAGIVAITKCDLVDDEIVDLVEMEVRDLLAGTGLDDAPVVRTSTLTGAGLDQLKSALGTTLGERPDKPAHDLVRLPIDRVFSVRGFGTVVTGTLLSGSVAAGDKLELLPSATAVTVRGVQVYGETVDAAAAGRRTAVNLQGIELDAVCRGDVLTRPGSMRAAAMIDARLTMLSEDGLEHLQRVRFHHGAAEILARAAIIDAEHIAPGQSAMVQLRLETPYACAPGDRFVIRRYSPMVTIGGGIVIDNAPAKHRTSDRAAGTRLAELEGTDDAGRAAWLVAGAGPAGIDEDDIGRRVFAPAARISTLTSRLAEEGILVLCGRHTPRIAVNRSAFEALAEAAIEAVAAHHRHYPLETGAPKSTVGAAMPHGLPESVLDALIEHLIDDGRLSGSAAAIALPDHEVRLDAEQAALRRALLDFFAEAGLSPPSIAGAWKKLGVEPAEGEALLHLVLRQGELVRLRDDLFYRSSRLEQLVETLRSRYAAGEAFQVAAFKELAGVSRKHAIPLLEYLDQQKVTRRAGDGRVRI